jgi:acylphosphatase
MNPSQRVHGFASGRVQGVWYRGFTETEALRLGLSGWVRNLRDGRVEFVAEGSQQALDAWLALLRVGPPGARVSQMEVHPEEAIGLEPGFVIRPSA